MQARRGIAALLGCVLGLLVLASIPSSAVAHSGKHSKHAVRAVALIAPTGVDGPQWGRVATDGAVPSAAPLPLTSTVRTGPTVPVRQLASSDPANPHVRGPPGTALA